MTQYNVTGMSCAACSARVEKAVLKLDGVTSCSVNLLTNSMGVEGTATPETVIDAVEKAGYGASIKSTSSFDKVNSANDDADALKDTQSPILFKRFCWSLVFLLVLMYISMGNMMWGWSLPAFLDGNHIALGLMQLLLTGIIMVINQKFFISGFKGLTHKSPNMDTLVALGAGASFIYSTYALFNMTDAQVKGDMVGVMSYMHEFYFESAAMILTLITLGKLLESRSKGKTTNALKGLMKLAPRTAVILQDGVEIQVPIEQVKKGDVFVVRPGESIPVDGIVLDGNTAIDESALTGESIPVEKITGSMVSAATINQSGFIKCEALRVGQDTTLSQVIRLVSDAAATKAPIAKIADKISGVFVPAVIGIAALTLAVWLILGQSIGFSLERAISVLVISCPCALGLATPVAIMVGSGMGAKNGILFKTAVSLEQTGKTQIVVLDKTGTITVGKPEVTDIIPLDDINEKELLHLAYSLEQKSEHPLAKAVVKRAQELGISPDDVTEVKFFAGNGLIAKYADNELCAGNASFIRTKCSINDDELERAYKLSESGKTPLFFSKAGKLIGIIAVADVIKDDSPEAIDELKNMGVRVIMLTGDNELTAKAIAEQVHVDEVISGVLPDGKESTVRKLKSEGCVAMVGDGINDAPALTSADIGIAIGAGADVAIDAADIVLVKNSLKDVAAAIRLSRATLRTIHQNLFWAFIYNIAGIPLAAGVWYYILGWKLNPMFGAAAMSLSSFCVVTNALRLNLFKMYNFSKDKKIKYKTKKENKFMQKTITIEGMMCQHCEARVKKYLEALEQVESAQVSYKDGTAIITLKSDIADDVLKSTVEAQDYKVISVK